MVRLTVMTMTHQHHAIDYIELGASDLAASKAFFAEAFGWGFNDYGPGYAGIQSGDGEAGGLNATGDAGPPLVLLYSDDLDGSVDAVRSAGGTVTAEPFDFPGGRRFHFTDPGGNEMGVWTEQ